MSVILRNVGSGGVVDIAESDIEARNQLDVYEDQHGGDNQLWKWVAGEELCPVRSCLDENLVLDISEGNLVENGKVILYPYHIGNNQLWRLRGCGFLDDIDPEGSHGMIESALDPNWVLADDRSGKLVIQKRKEECPHQTWEIVPAKAEEQAKPATSCHLSYQLPKQVEDCSSWELECSVVVESSCSSTYFCVIGWGPAGYSGIQQVDHQKRVAIFSMWNTGDHRVELISSGKDVIIDDFGGEGTGLKSMKEVSWKEGEEITLKVSGSSGDNGWTCSCSYLHHGVWHNMASFRRTGPRPLSQTGFYSFVEDWNRCQGAAGHTACRRADYFGQKLTIDGVTYHVTEAKFTKVEDGRDKFASSKAVGGVGRYRGDRGKCFFLSTGGDDSQDQCHHGTKLKL